MYMAHVYIITGIGNQTGKAEPPITPGDASPQRSRDEIRVIKDSLITNYLKVKAAYRGHRHRQSNTEPACWESRIRDKILPPPPCVRTY